jgi:hypothetical protein
MAYLGLVIQSYESHLAWLDEVIHLEGNLQNLSPERQQVTKTQESYNVQVRSSRKAQNR